MQQESEKTEERERERCGKHNITVCPYNPERAWNTHTHNRIKWPLCECMFACICTALCVDRVQKRQNTLGYCTLDVKSKWYYIYSAERVFSVFFSLFLLLLWCWLLLLPLMLICMYWIYNTILNYNDWHICHIAHRISICVWNVSHLPNENQGI